MNEPPKMLSNKDILYISDILNQQYVLVKKLNSYELSIKDKEIQKLIKRTCEMLKNNYNTLLEVLYE